MLFDVNNVFWGTAPYTAGNFATLVGLTGSTTSASTVINLLVPEDMGIGDGEAVPKLAVYIGTGVTWATGTGTIQIAFQGSTDSSNWTTYAQNAAASTASYTAGANVFPIDVPKRPPGVSLPQYYRLLLTTSSGVTVSSGTIMAGIVVQRDDSADTLGQYKSGFTVGA
jgi:hypothetical protein